MGLSERQRDDIRIKARLGTSFAELSREYGVTRERIRQICLEAGITRRELMNQRRDALIKSEAMEIVVAREDFVPVRWRNRAYSRAQFEEYLLRTDSKLYERWRKADRGPTSTSGHATRDLQFCVGGCDRWLSWDDFYVEQTRSFGKSARCKECSRKRALTPLTPFA